MRTIPDRARRVVRWTLVVIAAIALVLCGYLLHEALTSGDGTSEREQDAGRTEAAQAGQRWTCAMHPQINRPAPGKCPLCGMTLIPIKTETGGSMRQLTTSPQGQALMALQVSPVERKFVTAEIRMVGKVEYDETRLAYITSWIPGRIDELYVDYTGIAVKKGDHMVSLYSPELLSAQEELLQALKAVREVARSDLGIMRETAQSTVEAVREKLRLWGLTPEQIKAIETRGKTTDHMTISSPASGIVIHKNAQEGMYVKTGERIYTIADLSHVWVKLDAYESDLMWLRYGQKVAFVTEAYPGDKFVGTVSFIDPVLNAKTRTVKIRVDVPNADGRLKPEMFVRAVARADIALGGRVMAPDLAGKWMCPMHPSVVKETAQACDICGMPLVRTESLGYVSADMAEQAKPLVVPVSAVLVTGTRGVVYLQRNPFVIRAEDITDWPALVADLKRQRQAKEPMPGKRLWERFTPGLQTQLSDLGPLDTVSRSLAAEILGELNGVLIRRDFYEASLWKGMDLGDEVRGLLTKGIDTLSPNEVIRLNRRLLEHTCVDKIARAVDKPTFIGREILLGPRAKDYYIVYHGLREGEIVVTNGAFKIDSSLQIQAKPSMMTPEGGGGGGGMHHGGGGKSNAKKTASPKKASSPLPKEFKAQLKALEKNYEAIARAMKSDDLESAKAAFGAFGKRLKGVNGLMLTGHRRMMWNELAMLLGNDAVEGTRYLKRMGDARRVFGSLKKNMKRVRATFRSMPEHPQRDKVEKITVPAAFQAQLDPVWNAYRNIHSALAGDDIENARKAVEVATKALAAVDMKPLEGAAHMVWMKESATLRSSLTGMAKSQDLEGLRREFAPFSEEMAVILKTFGRVASDPIYLLKCPMAFNSRGALWLQSVREVQNPYLGSVMPGCGEVVEAIRSGPASATERGGQTGGRDHD